MENSPPWFKTLKAIATALGMEALDLLVEPEFLPQQLIGAQQGEREAG